MNVAIPHASEDAALDQARARLYAVLSLPLEAGPDAAALAALAGLDGDDTPLGRAIGALAAAAAATSPEAVARDHFDLFVGVGRGEILPYASYYLTGFLNERPLAAVRADLAALGLERAPGRHEPEDHLATLCAAMCELAGGGWRGSATAPDQAAFFQRHLAPWAARCFDDIARARATGFYPALGRLGAAFMAVEAEAFALPD